MARLIRKERNFLCKTTFEQASVRLNFLDTLFVQTVKGEIMNLSQCAKKFNFNSDHYENLTGFNLKTGQSMYNNRCLKGVPSTQTTLFLVFSQSFEFIHKLSTFIVKGETNKKSVKNYPISKKWLKIYNNESSEQSRQKKWF